MKSSKGVDTEEVPVEFCEALGEFEVEMLTKLKLSNWRK